MALPTDPKRFQEFMDLYVKSMQSWQSNLISAIMGKDDGTNRRADPTNNSDPADGADPSARGSFQGITRKSGDAIDFTYNSGFDSGEGGLSVGVDQNMIPMKWSTYSGMKVADLCVMEESPPIPYAGIRTGEMLGHRLWWVVFEDGEPLLRSLVSRTIWSPNSPVEGNVDEYINDDVIRGGVYSFNNKQDLNEDLTWFARMTRGASGPYSGIDMIVSGTIKMWGEVIECEKGYRAQFAKVNSIDAVHDRRILPEPEVVLEKLRKRYGV